MDDREREELRQAAFYQAWLDITSQFKEAQRIHIAGMMAHKWQIVGVVLRSEHGEERTFRAKAP